MYCNLLSSSLQGDQCQKQCEQIAKLYPDLAPDLSLIRATQMARDGRAREAASVLEKAASASPKHELEMKLASVQLLLAEVTFFFLPSYDLSNLFTTLRHVPKCSSIFTAG